MLKKTLLPIAMLLCLFPASAFAKTVSYVQSPGITGSAGTAVTGTGTGTATRYTSSARMSYSTHTVKAVYAGSIRFRAHIKYRCGSGAQKEVFGPAVKLSFTRGQQRGVSLQGVTASCASGVRLYVVGTIHVDADNISRPGVGSVAAFG